MHTNVLKQIHAYIEFLFAYLQPVVGVCTACWCGLSKYSNNFNQVDVRYIYGLQYTNIRTYYICHILHIVHIVRELQHKNIVRSPLFKFHIYNTHVSIVYVLYL